MNVSKRPAALSQWRKDLCGTTASTPLGIGEKLETIRKNTWAYVIRRCFNTDPRRCPRCNDIMIEQAKYSFEAGRAMKTLTATHYLRKGYFIPRRWP